MWLRGAGGSMGDRERNMTPEEPAVAELPLPFGSLPELWGRMQSVVRRKLEALSAADRTQIGKMLCLRKGLLDDITDGRNLVTVRLFHLLGGCLQLAPSDILGTPRKLDSEELAFWEEQRNRSAPIVIVATCGPADAVGKSVPLDLYLELRAMSKLTVYAERQANEAHH